VLQDVKKVTVFFAKVTKCTCQVLPDVKKESTYF